MFALTEGAYATKADLYAELRTQLSALLSAETDPIANAANTAALLFGTVPDINWAGFYFLHSETELVLGPFQGKPACVRIAVGRGVCGTAVERGATMLVEDVHAFPGHIACASSTLSEIVLPVRNAAGELLGVFDIDSDLPAAFTQTDARELQAILDTTFAQVP